MSCGIERTRNETARRFAQYRPVRRDGQVDPTVEAWLRTEQAIKDRSTPALRAWEWDETPVSLGKGWSIALGLTATAIFLAFVIGGLL